MNVKDLSNSQLVLLVIMLSFVVSISTATSVLVLIKPEETQVKQVINRVIERTIESKSDENSVPIVTTVKEIQRVDTRSPKLAIDSSRKNSVKLFRENEEEGFAVLISEAGHVVSSSYGLSPRGKYEILFGENKIPVEIVKQTDNFTLFKAGDDFKTEDHFDVLESNLIDVGTEIVIYNAGGEDGERIKSGIISSKSNVEEALTLFDIFPNISEEIGGSIAISYDGDLIGITTEEGQVISIHSIAVLLEK